MIDRVKALQPGPLDIHAHIIPEALVRRLAAGERPGFGLDEDGKGGRWIRLGEGGPRLPLHPGMDDMAFRFRTMQEQGVSAQLLSPWIALVAYHLGEEDAVWFADALNRSIGDVVAAHPDRFLGIGSVPLQFPERAAEMLRTAVEDLGLLGVEIAPSVRSEVMLDDPSLEPFWAAADSLKALVMVHPTLSGGNQPEFTKYYLNNLIHNPLATTTAAAHLMFGGVIERHPDMQVLLVHGGGYLPYGMGRLRRGHRVRTEAKVALTGDLDASYARFLFDTVTHSVSQLRFLVSEVGAERVLLGSDYPFDMADPVLVETVQKADLGARDEGAVLRGNAERVLSDVREA